MIPHHWKRAAADNGLSDPNVDVRPNRYANTILGSIRGLMASGAAARDDAIGELVAGLNGSTTNVYAVTTNEGLIDITTGINGVPAAITSPFLLRLSFDTTLAGSGTNVPHLMVDNFDCGPILRRDGSALADGDLVKGVPILVLGDMAASTDTKVTRVRVIDLTPSDIASLTSAAVFPTASATLSAGDGGRDQFASGAITLTMPAASVGWRSGVITNTNPQTGIVTLAVPVGATLDGVLNGTTGLLSYQRARIRQIGATAYVTDWVEREPSLPAQIITANTVNVDFSLPDGYSKFEPYCEGVVMSAASTFFGVRVSVNNGASIIAANYFKNQMVLDQSGSLFNQALVEPAAFYNQAVNDGGGARPLSIRNCSLSPGDATAFFELVGDCFSGATNGGLYEIHHACWPTVQQGGRVNFLRFCVLNNAIAKGTFGVRCRV